MDFAALLFEGFTLRASVAYADGENTDYPAGPARSRCRPPPPWPAISPACRWRACPSWSGTLGFDYRSAAGRAAIFVIHVDSSSRDGYYSDTSASQYTWIDGYNVTNASVGYRFASGWEVDVFARNLFDEDYITALTIQTGNSGLILGQPSDPRMVGVTFRYAAR